MVSVGLEPVTVKSINGSVFIFVSFIMSLETSIIVSVSLFSKRGHRQSKYPLSQYF